MASYDEVVAKMFEERLRNFYTKYDKEKLETVPTLLAKYKGKEENLIMAMVKKYGPEPTAEEVAGDEDDDEDDDTDDTDGDEDPNASGTKPAAKEAPEVAAEGDEDDDGDDDGDECDDGPVASALETDGPVVYCGVCGMPPEYCEFGGSYDKCIPWIKEHCPHLLDKDDGSAPDAAKKKGRRGGGLIKKKELPEEKQRVVMSKEVRSKKKSVTVVDGLDTLGVKLKDASKLFGKKFACSSSVKEKESGGFEIVVQGDIIYDLPDLLQSEYKIPSSKIFVSEKGKLHPV